MTGYSQDRNTEEKDKVPTCSMRTTELFLYDPLVQINPDWTDAGCVTVWGVHGEIVSDRKCVCRADTYRLNACMSNKTYGKIAGDTSGRIDKDCYLCNRWWWIFMRVDRDCDIRWSLLLAILRCRSRGVGLSDTVWYVHRETLNSIILSNTEHIDVFTIIR
jgi:hypothetical protein